MIVVYDGTEERKREKPRCVLCQIIGRAIIGEAELQGPGGERTVQRARLPGPHLPLPRDHVLSHRISASVPAETQSYFRHVGPRRDSNQTDSTAERAITNFIPRLRRQDVPLPSMPAREQRPVKHAAGHAATNVCGVSVALHRRSPRCIAGREPVRPAL